MADRLCPLDGLPLRTEAEEFLHTTIHALPKDAYCYGGLSLLPKCLYRQVAAIMQEFAEKQK